MCVGMALESTHRRLRSDVCNANVSSRLAHGEGHYGSCSVDNHADAPIGNRDLHPLSLSNVFAPIAVARGEMPTQQSSGRQARTPHPRYRQECKPARRSAPMPPSRSCALSARRKGLVTFSRHNSGAGQVRSRHLPDMAEAMSAPRRAPAGMVVHGRPAIAAPVATQTNVMASADAIVQTESNWQKEIRNAEWNC